MTHRRSQRRLAAAVRLRRTGVTLIEIMLSLVLVSTLLLVSLTASSNLLRNYAVSEQALDAEQLGGLLLDEITALEFEDIDSPVYGLEADESDSNRRSYDDVDDYDGYTAEPPTHRDGRLIAGYEGWSVSVEVTPAWAELEGIRTTTDEDAPLRWITVTSTAPSGESSTHSALVSQVPSDLDGYTSYERWRQLTLRFSERELTVSAPMRNRPDGY